jgi:hypothetical protein
MQGEDAGPADRVAEMIGFESSAFRRGFWRGAPVGFIAGLVFAALMWPSKANAAPGGIVGILTTDRGHTLTLYADAGMCVRGARAALWEDGQGTIAGCWVGLERQGALVVRVVFLDGDAYDLPAETFATPAKQRGLTL